MDNLKYNGWTNYATWRVNLEILEGTAWDDHEKVTADRIEEIVDDVVFNDSIEKNCLAAAYARSFLEDVNYEELAEAVNERWYIKRAE